MTTVLGLDIGGANLKMADLDGQIQSEPFEMWRLHQELHDRLRIMCWMERPQLVGLTMTAELADCFACKADGVSWVIDSVVQAFPESQVRVWLTSGEFAEPDDAMELPELVAAANWHALATWAGRAVPSGPGLLVDTGSTTTDIIPLLDGLPIPTGRTDFERLRSGELVYSGAGRTPLCAMLPTVSVAGTTVPVAAEVFATSQDVYVVRGDRPEDAAELCTADGRPLNRPHALARLARMLCCDRSELSDASLADVADQFAVAQRAQIAAAIQRVGSTLSEFMQASGREFVWPAVPVILSGSGAFVAAAAAETTGLTNLLDLAGLGHAATAGSACAHAVAQLVFERCRDDLLPVVPFSGAEA